jgi:3-oxoacyl-[acyl-carrier-protein] synthase II
VSARLWVTGLGLVTPLGVGVEATWARLVRGDRAIRPITLFDVAGQRVGVAAQVDGVTVPSAGWSRSSAMAATAAEEALRAARLDPRGGRVGLVVGGTTGGMLETEQRLARLHAEPECREVLAEMLAHPLTATGDRLHERLGPFARVRTLSSACSSGANALVVAASWLLAGELDAVLAGASDGLCRLTLSGFNALGAIDPEPCRPFDRRRRGTSLGEGAGFLVLEREESARSRSAAPIAELAGWALGAEAHHITNPAPDGAVVAALIERAIARAGRTSRDVDYVNAHGTGTPLNDPMEAAALARALGADIARVPVSSSKAQIGHTLGAAGAIEAAITALVVSRRTLVPTAGLDEPDPALDLVHVPHVGKGVARVRAALSSAFGFGGMDTVLVFGEADERTSRSSMNAAPQAGSPVITGVTVLGRYGLAGVDSCATLLDRPADVGNCGRSLRAAADVVECGRSLRAAADSLPDPDAHLDMLRARRLDRAARLGAVAVQHALAEAGVAGEETGLVLGSAFGNVDGSAAFMHRIFEKGARSASPAEFPNLVPSSPVGHVSIYLGLRGPAFATADLATSGESAFTQAVQLIVTGQAERVVAGAVEPRSDIVERVLAALFAHAPSQTSTARADVAAAIVLEEQRAVRARGGRTLALVRQTLEWREDAPAIAQVVAPRGGAPEVFLARPNGGAGELLERTAWNGFRRLECAPVAGESDGLGGVAIAVAASRLATGRASDALVLGLARGRGYAIVLSRE